MYKSHFDSPPGEGIPCTSVTGIESMIIENEIGSDVLAGAQTGTWKNLVPPRPPGQPYKIWMADVDSDCGCHIDSHFIYIYPDQRAR